MSFYQNINVGAISNDGTGDTLRNAFIKCNNNFNESLNINSVISSSVSSSWSSSSLSASYATTCSVFILSNVTDRKSVV